MNRDMIEGICLRLEAEDPSLDLDILTEVGHKAVLLSSSDRLFLVKEFGKPYGKFSVEEYELTGSYTLEDIEPDDSW